jgi:integrase
MAIHTVPKRFSDRYIDSLKPRETRYDLTDAAGLQVRVSPRGKRSFSHVYKFDGRPYRVTLGTYHLDAPDGITLADANARLAENRKRIARGVNPATGGDGDAPAVATVADLAREFYDRRLTRRVRPDWAKYLLDKDVTPALGNVRLSHVTPRLIVTRVLDPIADRGSLVHLNRVLALTKQMFSFAVSRGLLERSPAEHLSRRDNGTEEVPRSRVLTDVEIQSLWAAIHGDGRLSASMRLMFKAILLTGCRSGEIRTAKCKDVDLQARVWTIPTHKTIRQTHRAHDVPLSPMALETFEELIERADGSPWLVPSPIDPSKPLDMMALHHAARRMQGNVESPWSPHDIRRTLRTRLSALGIAPHVAELVLGHSLGRIERTYDVHHYDAERREALERWAEHVSLIVGERENVVSLGAKR